MATYEYNKNPVGYRFLNCIGFFEENDPILGNVWGWGKYTISGPNGNDYTSILLWDEKTQIMHARPIAYSKKINTIEGFRKVIESVNFLMSTEQ